VTDPGSAHLAPSMDESCTCPVCGAPVHPQPSIDHTIMTLMAVCDVLVVKALEKMGNYIVRASRERYNAIGDQPFYLAHTIWPANDAIVSKALKGAWDVVPLILDTHGPLELDAAVATAVLDQYVHDLAVTGARHELNVLAYRLRSGLELPVFIIHPSTQHSE
jgi:hypothetical protein